MPCPMHVLHELPVCTLASPISPSNPSTQSINFQMLEYHFQPRGSTLRSTRGCTNSLTLASSILHQGYTTNLITHSSQFLQICTCLTHVSSQQTDLRTHIPRTDTTSTPHHPVPFSPTPFALGFQPSPLPAPSSSRPPSIKTTLRPQIHDEKVTATLLQLRDSWNTRSGRNPLSLSLHTIIVPIPPTLPTSNAASSLPHRPNQPQLKIELHPTLPYPALPVPSTHPIQIHHQMLLRIADEPALAITNRGCASQ